MTVAEQGPHGMSVLTSKRLETSICVYVCPAYIKNLKDQGRGLKELQLIIGTPDSVNVMCAVTLNKILCSSN